MSRVEDWSVALLLIAFALLAAPELARAQSDAPAASSPSASESDGSDDAEPIPMPTAPLPSPPAPTRSAPQPGTEQDLNASQAAQQARGPSQTTVHRVSSRATRAPEIDPYDANPQAITEFSPHLAAYGRWVDHPVYGQVWVPHLEVVGKDFSPYLTEGHWELTQDSDWVWMSDYPFGWIVFHYGRWVWTAELGWAWIPGARYAHAWVLYRVPNDEGAQAYVGWGPAPPVWIWRNGRAVLLTTTPRVYYVFVASPYVFAHGLHHHVIYDPYWINYAAFHTHIYYAPFGYYPYYWGYPYYPHYHYPRRYYYRPRYVGRAPSPAAAKVPRSQLPARRTLGDRRALPSGLTQRVAPPVSNRQVFSSTQRRPRVASDASKPRVRPRAIKPAKKLDRKRRRKLRDWSLDRRRRALPGDRTRSTLPVGPRPVRPPGKRSWPR